MSPSAPVTLPIMRPAVIVEAVRTPIGARGGRLSGWHPVDLAAEVLRALVERSGIDPSDVDDVVLGCAVQVGNQALNVARSAVLSAGWPVAVPAGTVDRQGVSGLSAVVAAVHAVASGACDAVVAGGVEVMSTTPQGGTLVPGSVPFGPGMVERYRDDGGLVPAGVAAERLAESLGVDRAALDAVALRSHRRAAAAAPGLEVLPVASRVLDRDKGEVVRPGTSVTVDELPDGRLDADALAAFKPAFTPDGAVTAANSAGIGDGAAAVLVVSEATAARLDRAPLALVRATAAVGIDPLAMLAGAVPATRQVLAGAGLNVANIDRFEVGEAFAPVVLAWERALEVDPSRVNVGGGGIAIGEPTGSLGARLLVTLVHELARAGGGMGIAATGGGGGLGAAVLVERP